MPDTTFRSVLDTLPKSRLVELGRHFSVGLDEAATKDAHALRACACSDIPVPPFCVATYEDRAVLQSFEDEVIDRLFVLNAERAKKEAALGRGEKKKGSPPEEQGRLF